MPQTDKGADIRDKDYAALPESYVLHSFYLPRTNDVYSIIRSATGIDLADEEQNGHTRKVLIVTTETYSTIIEQWQASKEIYSRRRQRIKSFLLNQESVIHRHLASSHPLESRVLIFDKNLIHKSA